MLRDRVPGLLSFHPAPGPDAASGARAGLATATGGALTQRAPGLNSLPAPALAPAARASLARLRLSVPQALHGLVAALPNLGRGAPLPP